MQRDNDSTMSDWAIVLASESVIGPFESMHDAYNECEERNLSLNDVNVTPISSPSKYWGEE